MLYSAFLLGLISSLHCVGMCGPIALSLPYTRVQRWKIVQESLLYNFGRITTYAVLGLLLGTFGKGIAMVGYSQWISIGLGVILIGMALYKTGIQQVESAFNGIIGATIRKGFNKTMKMKNGFFLLGMLNGMLPCGIVFYALAASLLTFQTWNGALYMAIFGLGTMPLMLLTVVGAQFFQKASIRRWNKLIPAYQFALGAFLIYRAFLVDASSFWMLGPIPMCH